MATPLILPSGIAREVRGTVMHDGAEYAPLHCIACGKQNGYMRRGRHNFGAYLCDGPCADKWSAEVGTMLIPDEVVWARMREEQLAENGRLLAPHELAIALADDTSTLSKLVRDLPAHD